MLEIGHQYAIYHDAIPFLEWAAIYWAVEHLELEVDWKRVATFCEQGSASWASWAKNPHGVAIGVMFWRLLIGLIYDISGHSDRNTGFQG